jgi:hypothetical protein
MLKYYNVYYMQGFLWGRIIETDKILIIIDIWSPFIRIWVINKYGPDYIKDRFSHRRVTCVCSSKLCVICSRTDTFNLYREPSENINFQVIDNILYVIRDKEIYYKFTTCGVFFETISSNDFARDCSLARHRNIDIIDFTPSTLQIDKKHVSAGANKTRYLLCESEADDYNVSKYFACTPDIRIYFYAYVDKLYPADTTIIYD